MNKSSAPNSNAAASEQDIGEQIEILRADLARLTDTITQSMSDQVEKAGQSIGQTGRDARANATKAVLEHPLTAMGIAAGIGLLLGLVARKG